MESLFVVRHGPTHAKGLVGWTDLPADLSDIAALSRLSDFLPAEAAVVSSDLKRAVQTADAIVGPRVRLPHMKDLREMHFGEWEMANPREMDLKARAALAAFWEEPELIRPPGGESWLDFTGRVWPATRSLMEQTRGPLVIVAHYGVIASIAQLAEGLDAETAMGHKFENLSVSEFRHAAGRWETVRINHVP